MRGLDFAVCHIVLRLLLERLNLRFGGHRAGLGNDCFQGIQAKL